MKNVFIGTGIHIMRVSKEEEKKGWSKKILEIMAEERH